MNNEKNEHKSETEQALDEAELIEKPEVLSRITLNISYTA